MKKKKKRTTSQALDYYYSDRVNTGEVELTGENEITINKLFPSFLSCDSILNHWGRILRKITGETTTVKGKYTETEGGKEVEHSITRKNQKQFLRELSIWRIAEIRRTINQIEE